MPTTNNINIDDLKSIQISILDKFHKFCEDNDIKYSLACGSLLGAVRHKGFIPWDDDIDVALIRSEYNKLIKAWNNNPIEGLSLISNENRPDSPFPITKLCDDSTELIEDLLPYFKYGVYIDVFPIDPVPEGRFANLKFKLLIKLAQNAPKFARIRLKRAKDYKTKKYMILCTIIKYLFFFVKPNILISLYTYIVSSMNQNVENFAHIALGTAYKKLPKSLFEGQEEVEFEGKRYKAFHNYRKYLEIMFGDYMSPPPPEKRISLHNFTATKK